MTSYKNKAKDIISKNLKKYREASGITQISLSIQICKSSEYISRIERGVMLPGIEVLYEIADVLNIDPCLLISNKHSNKQTILKTLIQNNK